MHREVIAGTIAAGLLLTACQDGVESKVKVVESSVAEYIEDFGCPVSPKVVYQEVIGDSLVGGGTSIARTIGTTIVVSDELFEQTEDAIKHAGYHEAVHACSEIVPRTFDKKYKVLDVLEAFESKGFDVAVTNEYGERATIGLIEEGFAEHLARKQGYDVSGIDARNELYIALSALTGEVLDEAAISDTEAVELHDSNDFVGLIAMLNGVDKSEVSDQMVDDLLRRYTDTADKAVGITQ